MTAELFALSLALLAIAVVLVYTIRTGAPPTPTSPKVRRALIDTIPPVGGDVICELGAGWGSLAFPLARRFPKSTVIAYELSPLPWLFIHIRRALSGPENLIVRHADFLGADLTDADIVVCYLGRTVMERLKPKLERELRDGSVVVSHTFAMTGWTAESEKRANDLYASPILVYRMPQNRK
ncbi:MAG: hypothetical protein OQJ87_00970 [Rhodospirillales bacterium]|nr:hypothetical protein [Rhodospirillales bacterium]MCW9001265.1 hypothetical protein [Rhodospirillales bacterium]